MNVILTKQDGLELPAVTATGRGPYMHSANGRKIYPFDPRPEEIDIEVVAHHLATNNRWNGATQHKRFRTRITFSVAEHSVLCARYVRDILGFPEFELETLLHDAPEYLFGDLIRPFKHHPLIHPIIKPIEDRAEKAVAEKFNLIFPLPKQVKIADEAVCAAEAQQIVPKDEREEWESGKLHIDTLVAPYEIQMLDAYSAKEMFLIEFEDAIRRRERYRALPREFALYCK